LEIPTDDVAYVNFEDFYFNISSPILRNVKLSFNCDAALSNITIGIGNTFYKERDNFIVGKQTNRPIELKITGLSIDGPYSKTIEIPPIESDQVTMM
jgi:hypothetical protein